MLKKINHHTHNQAACICIAACLLFLSALTACSSEPEPEVMGEEWVPLEINIAGIEKMEVSPMSKAETTELPDFIRTQFRVNDELKLQYDGKTTSVFLQADGSWKTQDGTSLMLRPNTTYTIKAEYGTEILGSNYSTTDYLLANATPTYNTSTQKYACTFSFARPSNYSCLKIEFSILDPGYPIDGEYVTFISAAFYTANSQYALTTEFPIDNNRIEVLYNGEFTAYGVYLKRSHGQNAVDLLPFDSANNSFNFTVTRGHITNMLLIYPYPMWE